MNFFIIGMRRSGTSILRKLLLKHPDISGIEFEPHPLWNAVDILHFDRIKKCEEYLDYILVSRQLTERFFKKGIRKHYGAKFALNPGTKALEWKWLHKTFPEAKFIFIQRLIVGNWNSFRKQDSGSFRGMLDNFTNYEQWYWKLNDEFRAFSDGKKAIHVQFEELLQEPEVVVSGIHAFLGLKYHFTNLDQYINQPEFTQKQVTA